MNSIAPALIPPHGIGERWGEKRHGGSPGYDVFWFGAALGSAGNVTAIKF
jgi:hypothetical protein